MGKALYTLSIMLLSASCPANTKRAEVLRKVALSTVVVHADLVNATSQGSGTVIGINGSYSFVLTCHHVIAGAIEIAVHPTANEKLLHRSWIEIDEPQRDLALLIVKDLDLPALPIASADPELYDPVYLVGAPRHEDGSASEGIISDLDYHFKTGVFWRVSNGYITAGISGGTATNVDGELIGVPARGATYTTQLGLLIPREAIVNLVGAYAHASK